jgi:hypothetical protein
MSLLRITAEIWKLSCIHGALGELKGTGTLKGSDINFNLKGTAMAIEIIFTGKLTGEKMEGTREVDQGAGGGPPAGGPGGGSDTGATGNSWSTVRK